MKTTNKIQKAAFTTVAATGLIILGFSVDSQSIFRTYLDNDEAGNYAMMGAGKKPTITDASLKSRNHSETGNLKAYMAVETDEPMNLEEWMISDFDKSDLSENETESAMELEEWMTNDSKFEVKMISLETESEEEMELEPWMIDVNKFNVNASRNDTGISNTGNKVYSTEKFFYTQVTEKKLQLENWMFKSEAWK